jgi:hypothetical protein
MWETDFYCDQCEYNSMIDISVDVLGFEVICPNCKTVWWFSAEITQPTKRLNESSDIDDNWAARIIKQDVELIDDQKQDR